MLEILLLSSLYLIILIPMSFILMIRSFEFYLNKKNKLKTAKIPNIKEEEFINENLLINLVDLAYLFKKDSPKIISESIKDKILTPYYCHDRYMENNVCRLVCYQIDFRTDYMHCYDKYYDKIYFLKEEVVNVKNKYFSWITTNGRLVSADKMVTPDNIIPILRSTISKVIEPYPPLYTYKGIKETFNLFHDHILLSCIIRLYGFFLLDIPDVSYNQTKIDNYYYELIEPKRKITLLDVLMSHSPEKFKEYVYQHETLEKNEIAELYFWGSHIMTYKELGMLFDKYFPTPTPEEALKKLTTNKFEMRAIRGKEEFLKNFSKKDAKLFDVIPMLYKDFYIDNSLE